MARGKAMWSACSPQAMLPLALHMPLIPGLLQICSAAGDEAGIGRSFTRILLDLAGNETWSSVWRGRCWQSAVRLSLSEQKLAWEWALLNVAFSLYWLGFVKWWFVGRKRNNQARLMPTFCIVTEFLLLKERQIISSESTLIRFSREVLKHKNDCQCALL